MHIPPQPGAQRGIPSLTVPAQSPGYPTPKTAPASRRFASQNPPPSPQPEAKQALIPTQEIPPPFPPPNPPAQPPGLRHKILRHPRTPKRNKHLSPHKKSPRLFDFASQRRQPRPLPSPHAQSLQSPPRRNPSSHSGIMDP